MKISKPEEQAMRLVMRMATHADQATLGELSALERLPEPTVAKLLGRLRQGGIVEVQRGRNGGYVLALPPAEITVAAVIRAGQLLIPKPDLVLRAHDELLAVVHAEDAGQLAALLG